MGYILVELVALLVLAVVDKQMVERGNRAGFGGVRFGFGGYGGLVELVGGALQNAQLPQPNPGQAGGRQVE